MSKRDLTVHESSEPISVPPATHLGTTHPLPAGLRIEPTARWIRVYLGNVAVADSRRALLVFEPGHMPEYWFPTEDVRTDLLELESRDQDSLPVTEHWTLSVGDRVVRDAAWSYPDASRGREAMRGHIAFEWDKMDAWFEEDDEVFFHPRHPNQRVDALRSSRHVRVEVDGHVLADTTRPTLLFETGLPTRYYIPKLDVRMDLLEPTDRKTRCPYKGEASFWSAKIGRKTHENIVWSYPTPIPECPKIENLLAFYNERVDIYVDGELQPRPRTSW